MRAGSVGPVFSMVRKAIAPKITFLGAPRSVLEVKSNEIRLNEGTKGLSGLAGVPTRSAGYPRGGSDWLSLLGDSD